MTGRALRLGDFLTRSEEWVKLEPDITYKQVTARLWGKGLVLRGEVAGSEIAASRQLRARSGQFLVSRIDARHGAFGVVPEDLDGALVSNDFPCFDIDPALMIPHYFEWYSRTQTFIDLCRRSSEGSTNRVRLKEDAFLQMKIEVPPLDEQWRIVARLDRVAGLIGTATKLRAKIDDDIVALVERLHFELSEAGERPLDDFIELWEDRVDVEPDGRYPQVGLRGFAGGLFLKDAVAGMETSYRSFNRLRPDLLIVSQPKGWEGAIAVCEDAHDGWFASPEYRTFRCRDGLLDAEYLRRFIETRWFQHQLSKLTRGQGARRERLRPDMLLNMLVNMPSITAQRKANEIIRKLCQIRMAKEPFEHDAGGLIPAMLHEVFNGEARRITKDSERPDSLLSEVTNLDLVPNFLDDLAR